MDLSSDEDERGYLDDERGVEEESFDGCTLDIIDDEHVSTMCLDTRDKSLNTQQVDGYLDEHYLASIRPKERVSSSDILTESSACEMRFMLIDLVLKLNNQSKKPKFMEAFIFGRTNNGLDVCIIGTGWQPYFYVKAPVDWSIMFQGNKDDFAKILLALW